MSQPKMTLEQYTSLVVSVFSQIIASVASSGFSGTPTHSVTNGRALGLKIDSLYCYTNGVLDRKLFTIEGTKSRFQHYLRLTVIEEVGEKREGSEEVIIISPTRILDALTKTCAPLLGLG